MEIAEQLFNNNIYVIFGFILYTIFTNDNLKHDNKKIIVIYTLMAMLAIFNVLDIKIMLGIFLLLFFLYFEVLIDDYFKLKLFKKISFKFIDCFYLLFFKFSFICFIWAMFMVSDLCSSIFQFPDYQYYFYFAPIFIYVILFISNNDFELKSFDEIIKVLEENVDFNNYEKLSYNKYYILTTIEDKSFYERMNDYTIFCWDFIKYRICKINEVLFRVEISKGRRHNVIRIIKFLKYALKQTLSQLKDIPRFIRRIYNGHSTIEMQLFRSIAVKDGYKKKHQRKIAELIYTPLFFKGLKEYYKSNYQKVSNQYFKNYIIACYLKSSLVFYKGKTYSNIYTFFRRKKVNINDCAFLFYVLCLSGKLNDCPIEVSYFKYEFGFYLDIFCIDDKQLENAVKKFQKILNY